MLLRHLNPMCTAQRHPEVEVLHLLQCLSMASSTLEGSILTWQGGQCPVLSEPACIRQAELIDQNWLQVIGVLGSWKVPALGFLGAPILGYTLWLIVHTQDVTF